MNDLNPNPLPTQPSGEPERKLKKRSWLRRMFVGFLSTIAALILLFEEWLWDKLVAITQAVGQWPGFAWLERKIAALPAWAALIVFLLPGAMLFPVKLGALYLIKLGHSMMGMGLFIAAKLVGTAIVARIFTLTRPTLMTIGWFARCYNAFIGFKNRIVGGLKATAAYQATRERLKQIKQALRNQLAAVKTKLSSKPGFMSRLLARLMARRRAKQHKA